VFIYIHCHVIRLNDKVFLFDLVVLVMMTSYE
jgi:hypothetical protein